MYRFALASLFVIMGHAHAAQGPGLGDSLDPGSLQKHDFTILPDGAGLPPGSGSVEEGAKLYTQHCQACHGEDGQSGSNDALAGGLGSLTSAKPVKTVGSFWPYATTVFDYIRRAMPYAAPGSLSADQTYAVTAWLLYINDIIDEDTRLSARTLPNIEMPNRRGFVWSEEVR
ncbi:MAG: cytochrome c [Pseudomonadales bacterium]|jgi:cytochrome c|nr:cytochrome c [Pseudomonadales bacterium]MDP6469687.1 cytochrome c [Pseudomonadales bacterium]MDP6828928.1 cytochrome c [Pseudomonadales bacterium]MDP6972728.1 cytochrome c [Pseudomonadales bacterium]